MTHITESQKQQIAELRAGNVSLTQIAKKLAMPLGSVKTIYYAGRPRTTPAVQDKNGKFRSVVQRTGPGRPLKNGLEPQTPSERAAAYRARKRAALLFSDAPSRNEAQEQLT